MMTPSSIGHAVGNAHASHVMLPLGVSATGLPRSTTELPLKVRASPYLPEEVHVAPFWVPLMPLPDWSLTAAPKPSFRPQAPTRPFCGVALATFENGPE